MISMSDSSCLVITRRIIILCFLEVLQSICGAEGFFKAFIPMVMFEKKKKGKREAKLEGDGDCKGFLWNVSDETPPDWSVHVARL